jgi:hypothetical protein
MHTRGPALISAAVAVMAVAACGGNTTTAPTPATNLVTFKATMTFGAETPTPPVASTATGTFTATLDTSTNIFTWDLTFTGLTGNAVAGHIHGPATTTQAAGTTINFFTAPGATITTTATTGTGHGSMLLNAGTAVTATMTGDSLKKLLFAGLTYANIHTSSNPSGEIRGQITKQ